MYRTPVVYLSLSEESEELYKSYCNIIEYVTEEFGVEVYSRNSFGFRNINFEYFKLSETNDHLLKIAPGILKGVNFYVLIFILSKLSHKTVQEIFRLEEDLRRRL